MDITIREAGADDASVVALLAQVTFRQAFGTVWGDVGRLNRYLRTTFSVEKVRSSLAKPNNGYWLALADDLPVGYAKVKKHCPYTGLADPAPAQLQKIYILDEYIGNGVGAKLQERVFDAMGTLGIRTLWLAVWVGNEKAIRFYARHGFRKETDYTYDFEDLHFDYDVMVRTL